MKHKEIDRSSLHYHNKQRLAKMKECAKSLGLDIQNDNVYQKLSKLWDEGHQHGFYYGS